MTLKVAAYQAPLLAAGSMAALDRIRDRVAWCEANGVSILCCPEAVLGGLADDSHDPTPFALSAADGQLEAVLSPLASDRVATIVGVTEAADGGRLYNSAVVVHRGSVVGVYRKMHPAINRSVYDCGREAAVFTVDGLTFGIVICHDSNFPELTSEVAARGAAALFVPTNNGLPEAKGGARLVEEARSVDVAAAVRHGMWVIRADVAGRAGGRVSYGSTAVIDPTGALVAAARPLEEDLIVVHVRLVDATVD